MTKMRAVALGLLLALGTASPALADHSWDGGGYDEGCGRNGGGCGNEREESYEGAGCKYVCPSFDKSPVHDAFNFGPQICMPGATCHFDDRERRQQPPEEGQQP